MPANGGDATAILVKMTSSTAKSLLVGAELELLFGVESGYLCVGVRVFDIPESPLLIFRVQRHEEDHAALIQIAQSGTSPIFLFSEIDVCVAWSKVQITEQARINLQKFLQRNGGFYSGEYSNDAISVLDSFCEVTDHSKKVSNPSLEVLVVPITYGVWTSNQISFFGEFEHHTLSIDDAREGEVLERAVWAALESVFPTTLRKSPQVVIGKKSRELTDVLAVHRYGTFLVESKDLSVLQAGIKRSRERRLKGTQKQALTAICQLIGASKAIRRRERITDFSGKPITLQLDQPMHCIVLLTELIHEGDWTEVATALFEAASETGEFFHIVDFSELINILKLSRGDSRLVDYNLMKRFECFVESRSVHIRVN